MLIVVRYFLCQMLMVANVGSCTKKCPSLYSSPCKVNIIQRETTRNLDKLFESVFK